MRYLFGKAILSVCFSFLVPPLSEGKSIYDNVKRTGSVYMPGALPSKEARGSSSLAKKKAKNSYTFVYMQDHYGVSDKGKRGIFESIYDKRYGTLLASYDYYVRKKKIGFDMGTGDGGRIQPGESEGLYPKPTGVK